MDAAFTFPPQNIVVPRPSNATAGSTGDPLPRESDALRASVLDAALELGFSSNSLVSDWMFNDATDEAYQAPISSPTLTHTSSVNSENSNSPSSSPPFPYTPSTSSPTSSSQSHNLYYLRFDPAAAENPANPIPIPRISESDLLTPLRAHTDIKSPTPTLISRPATPVSGRKLKKKRADDDDSDKGYLSEGPTRKKDKKKDTAITKQASFVDLKERAKAAKVQAKEEKLLEKKKKEDDLKRQKAAKKALEKEVGYSGYETDGGVSFGKSPQTPKKAKSKGYSGDGGYETDAGYHSATPKRKNTFFGLRSKSSRADVQHLEPLPIPPMEKEKEFMPLPIAERFATTLLVSPKVSISSEGTFMPSRGGTPMPDSPQISTSSHSSAPQPSTYDRLAPERASHSSGESSATNSTNSKRKGVQFSPTSSQISHGRGGGSFSTITSISQVPPPPSPGSSVSRSPSRQNSRRSSLVKFLNISPFPIARSPSPDPTNTLARKNSTSAFPTISYPVTRSLSPDPEPPRPITPLITQNASKTKRKPTINTSLLNSNPDLLSNDPFASPGMSTLSPSVYSPAGSRSPGGASPRPRFGPRASSGASPSPGLSPSGHLQPIIVPSSNYLVPSPNASPLPAPSVLAYYDIPPPSPPPAGPLPNVPSGLSVSAGAFPTLRPRVRERLIAQEQAVVQRGREAPFPAPALSKAAAPTKVDPPRVGERKVDRYRDLYSANSPTAANGRSAQVVKPNNHDRNVHFQDDEDEEGDEVMDVLDQYEDTSFEEQNIGLKALGSGRSFEANEENHFSISNYYTSAGTEDPANGRSTMYSIGESVYSRASFLDSDKSESTRERFIQRVEAMLNAEGRRGYQDIPPVPKLPEGLKVPTFTPGKNWNRF